MRLPINEKVKSIEFVNFINDIDKELRDSFEISIKKNLESVKIKVMLADFTVIETNTFDPERILNYFFNKRKGSCIIEKLEGSSCPINKNR